MSLLNDENDREPTDRAVPDAIHSRFRTTEVRCNICNINIGGNYAAISKHFDRSHPSKEHCCYCNGKVFTYVILSVDDSTEKPRQVVYHKCAGS